MIDPKNHKINLVRSINAVVVINLILAVVSFLKDILFAAYFGTSNYSDVLLLAFFVPDTIGNGLIGAASGVAVVPVLSMLVAKQDLEGFRNCIKGIQVFMFMFCGFIMVGLYIFSSKVIEILGKGFSEEFLKLGEGILKILLPVMMIFAFIHMGNGIMQVFGKFRKAAFAPVLFNTVFLAGIVITWIGRVPIEDGVYNVSLSIVLSVMSMLLFVAYNIARIKGTFFTNKKHVRKNNAAKGSVYYLKKVLFVFFPYLSILLCSQIVLAYERAIASSLGAGSIAGLNYAYRLAQFPAWVFVLAISAVILPSMSMDSGMGRSEGLNNTLEKAISMIILWAVPMTLVLNILREPIITVLFKRGAFNDVSVRITSAILAGYSLTIVTQGLLNIYTRAFLARRSMAKPLIAFVVTATVNIISDVILVKRCGVAGIGYGAAIGTLIGALVMLGFVKKEFSIHVMQTIKKYSKALVVHITLGIIMLLCRIVWYNYIQTEGFTALLVFISSVFVLCGGIYYVALRKFRYI